MSWDKGFDFRATSGLVTDPADCTYVLASDTYPVTRNGVTFGWTVAPTDSRDRSVDPDPRLCGIIFGNGNGTFRVDLPSAGTYAIRLAMGDYTATQSDMTFTIKDDAATVLSYGPFTTGLSNFFDAVSVEYSPTNWPGSNTPVNQAFSSTILNLLLGAATTNTTIVHVFLSQLTVPDPSFGFPFTHLKSGDGMSTAEQRWKS